MIHSSIMGSSSAERRIHCTGSASLESQMTEVLKDWALEGTALHHLLYKALDTGEMVDVTRPYAFTDPESEKSIEVKPQVLQDKLIPALEAYQWLIETHEIVEYDLELTLPHPQTCGPDVFGTLDFAGRSARGYAVVADTKFGSGVRVFAKENFQLAFNAVGLWEAQDSFVKGVDTFLFAIVQPNPAAERPEDHVDLWETSMWWVENYRLMEREAYLRIKRGETGLKAGKWCQFCKARAICPEQNQNLTDFTRQAPTEPLPGGIDAIQLARLLRMGEQAKKQYDALVKFAEQQADERGVQIPGYKLIDSYGHRRYVDEEAALLAATQIVGTEAVETKLKSPAQLQKVFKKLREDFSVMDTHVERPYRGTRLVPDTNPTPETHAATDLELPFNVVPLQVEKKRKKQ